MGSPLKALSHKKTHLKMSPIKKITVFLLETLGDQLWGFKPNLMRAFVSQQGARRSLCWFAKNMPKYERTLEAWGPIRTHLVATAVSTLNGCAYSTVGHAYALQLHYLKNTDRLFPLTSAEIFRLHTLSEPEFLERWEQVLNQAGLGQEIFPLQRMVELRRNRGLAVTKGDRNMLHLITMIEDLNVCGVSDNVRSDQAHDPINKNRAIRDRYAALRNSQQQSALYAQQAGKMSRQLPFQPLAPTSQHPRLGKTILAPDD
ncbi:MAG: hypothetical protein AAGC93_10580 [Cyanobacteria bacterium P01_F01_bin.53]